LEIIGDYLNVHTIFIFGHLNAFLYKGIDISTCIYIIIWKDTFLSIRAVIFGYFDYNI